MHTKIWNKDIHFSVINNIKTLETYPNKGMAK